MGVKTNVERLESLLGPANSDMRDISKAIRVLVNAYVFGLDDTELADTRSPEYRAAIGLFQGWLMIAIHTSVMQAIIQAEIGIDFTGGKDGGNSDCGAAP